MTSEHGDSENYVPLPKWNKNDRIGDRWVLKKKLGGAHVWSIDSVIHRPRQPPERAVAKRMRHDDASENARERFFNEVKGLEALGNIKGVVPLLDREPGERSRWFVMQAATPLIDHVHGKSFRSLVRWFAELAETLAQLHHDKGVTHRDIKPDNLFWLDNTPAFGDFGIAGWEDRVRHTQELNKLGPFAYLAPEALNPKPATYWPAADVYSLVKTMWSLAEYQYECALRDATGELADVPILFPPQGEMNSTTEWAYSFRRFFGPAGYHLDPLLRDATSNDPFRRPTARDIRDEFRAWLRLTKGVEPAPSPRNVYGTLVNNVERFNQAKAQYFTTLQSEIKSALENVDFDSSVNVEWRFDPDHEVDGPAVLASHGRKVAIDDCEEDGPRPPNPWEGALILRLLPDQGDLQAIVGGVMGDDSARPMVDLVAEVQRTDSEGRRSLVREWTKNNINAEGPVIVEALRDILQEVTAEIPIPPSTWWTSSRVR
ncbi:protein kinase domain-containing protein [Rhodococcus sp. NPDC003348]